MLLSKAYIQAAGCLDCMAAPALFREQYARVREASEYYRAGITRFQTRGFHHSCQQIARFSQLYATLRLALRRNLFHQKAFKVITFFCQPHIEAQVITEDCQLSAAAWMLEADRFRHWLWIVVLGLMRWQL